jgi:hypothetical protein
MVALPLLPIYISFGIDIDSIDGYIAFLLQFPPNASSCISRYKLQKQPDP